MLTIRPSLWSGLQLHSQRHLEFGTCFRPYYRGDFFETKWLLLDPYLAAPTARGCSRPVLLKDSVSRCEYFLVYRPSSAISAGRLSLRQTERTHTRRLPLGGRPSALRDRVAPYRPRFFALGRNRVFNRIDPPRTVAAQCDIRKDALAIARLCCSPLQTIAPVLTSDAITGCASNHERKDQPDEG